MEYNVEVFIGQFYLIKFFVYHLTYYRELNRNANLGANHVYFWKFTTDVHLLQASIYWCMVFGSPNSNPTHWKHLATSQEDAQILQETLRKAVLKHTGFTSLEWDKYWKQMVDFRNKYVVHRDDFDGVTPHFDKALAVADAYDRWIREVIWPDTTEEPPLKSALAEAKKSVRAFLKELRTLKHQKDRR